MILVLLTILISSLAACGVFLIIRTLTDAVSYPIPRKNTVFIVRLEGNSSQVQQIIRACFRLREYRGYGEILIFTDGGIDAEAQLAAELMLRKHPEAVLCAPEQVVDYIRWEKETVGAGTD